MWKYTEVHVDGLVKLKTCIFYKGTNMPFMQNCTLHTVYMWYQMFDPGGGGGNNSAFKNTALHFTNIRLTISLICTTVTTV